MPVRRHQKLDQLLQTLTLEDLQDLRDAMQARTTDVRAHLDRMRPLFEGSGKLCCPSGSGLSLRMQVAILTCRCPYEMHVTALRKAGSNAFDDCCSLLELSYCRQSVEMRF